MIRPCRHLWLIVLLIFDCQASDPARESEYAEHIAATLAIGEIVWLQAEQARFLTIYTETEFRDGKDAAIILHDKGSFPDQKPIMHGLRTELPKHRWSTLAVQMPLREWGASGADYYDLFSAATARLQSAVAFLKQKDYVNIALVGQGIGALMALSAQETLRDDIKALGLIELPVPNSEHPSVQTLDFLEKTDLPVLDLYTSRQLTDVSETAAKKRLASKQNVNYSQVRVDDDERMIVKRVFSWLRRIGTQFESPPAPENGENTESMPAEPATSF